MMPNTATKGRSTPKAQSAPPKKGLMLATKNDNEPHVRTSQHSGKVIFTNLKDNPRREGTFGWHSFEIVRAAGKRGVKYEDYRAAGGRPNDLQWDIDHGYVELK
jgi:hypothetical protein